MGFKLGTLVAGETLDPGFLHAKSIGKLGPTSCLQGVFANEVNAVVINPMPVHSSSPAYSNIASKAGDKLANAGGSFCPTQGRILTHNGGQIWSQNGGQIWAQNGGQFWAPYLKVNKGAKFEPKLGASFGSIWAANSGPQNV